MNSVRCAAFIAAAMFCLSGEPAIPAERINHEGRVLGAPPVVGTPVLFNTTEADRILSAVQILPRDNPWNEDVSNRPLLPNSEAMIAKIIAELGSTRRTLRIFFEMNFVLVPDTQPLIPITFVDYADESDPGPYPIPSNLPIETWPRETGALTLSDWQMDVNATGGDRHAIIVQPGTGDLFETWQTKLVNGAWEASNGAKFNLCTNGLRPASWTSADAAGLPIFPALIRYDECQRGMVEHAVRLVVKHTRREYLYPARHYASVPTTTDTNVPAMGQRLRLKAGFAIPESWSVAEKAVLRGLKKYGALVADNGGFFSISATPDDRWAANEFSHLNLMSITNFEVVQSTGPNEGPRSAGAPSVNAGTGREVAASVPVSLGGSVTAGSNARTQWIKYSGPGMVTFADAAQPQTTATFSEPGEYLLRLSAEDGVHTPAYDVVTFRVGAELRMTALNMGNEVSLSWTGGVPPYSIETTGGLGATWELVTITDQTSIRLPMRTSTGFFRVRQHF